MNQLRLLPLLLFCCLLLPAAAYAQKRGPVVTSKDGGFNITLPAGFEKPERESEETEDENGLTTTVTFTSANERGVCLISFTKFPASLLELAEAQVMLDAARDSVLSDGEAQLEKEENITFQGHEGRTVYLTASTEGIPLYSRFDWIIAAPYLYQVAFVGFSRDALDTKQVRDYFGSFKLTSGKKKKK